MATLNKKKKLRMGSTKKIIVAFQISFVAYQVNSILDAASAIFSLVLIKYVPQIYHDNIIAFS